MRRHEAWRPIVLVLSGLLAGSLLAPPIVHAAARTPARTIIIPNRQSVLASNVCAESCSTTLHACGTIGGVVAQGYGDVLVTAADGTVIWKADPNGASGSNRFSDMFDPGILFTTDVTVMASVGSGIRYIVYGNTFRCAGG